MEFPDLGDQCSNRNCKQLDFLPLRCDSCQRLFCKNHYIYDQHGCPEAYRRDNQVPQCPLCYSPIPVRPGDNPDLKVGQHIDTNCQSQPARQMKGKIFGNRCSVPKCKKKELVPFKCSQCGANHCISHRLEVDHNCTGTSTARRGSGVVSSMGAAAIWRAARSLSNTVSGAGRETKDIQAAQRGITDDEALALALKNSQQQSVPVRAAPGPANTAVQDQEAADRALALALQASEREERQRRLQSRQQAVSTTNARRPSEGQNSSCQLS